MDDPSHTTQTGIQTVTQTVVDRLWASQLRDVVHRYAEALHARRKGIDQMNVYPVPDGDTGTNMSLTVQSVVNELRNAAGDDMAAITHAISRGAIMGARGNSGAILAQVLRGIAESAKQKASLGPADVAEAFDHARIAAYESVLKPVEGTILTVLTAAAVAARKSADAGHQLKEQLDHIRQASAEALARTPELLPVLKQAGVVDAGGSGFLLLIDALRYVATGEPIPGLVDDVDDLDDMETSTPDPAHAHAHVGTHANARIGSIAGDIADLRYEVMFLLDAHDIHDAHAGRSLQVAWQTVGDSIVVVGGDGLWNCHIHTDDIGASIEAALDIGRPHQIRVTDLLEQAEAHGPGHVHEHGHEAPVVDVQGVSVEASQGRAERVTTAVVAVVNGDGLAQLHRSLGAQQLVVGGQSMNPSVAELVQAVQAAPSNAVIILPNNANVISAARQVHNLTGKEVVVVPTINPVQGVSVLMAYDSARTLDKNQAAMTEAAQRVVPGEVTQSVRDTQGPTGPICKGDWLGIGPNGISVVAQSLSEALCGVVEQLTEQLTGELTGSIPELVTLVEGEGANAVTTNALRAWMAEHRPAVELDVQWGGQPLYPYMFAVE